MIKPTVGRTILYNPCPKDNLEQLADEKGLRKNDPLMGFIIAVHNDTRVNLLVISAYGQTRFLSRVELWQGEGERPNIKSHGYAEWMPFQIGQSKKTEELEKQLHQTQASGQSQEQAP
jgi:hypothetical protein